MIRSLVYGSVRPVIRTVAFPIAVPTSWVYRRLVCKTSEEGRSCPNVPNFRPGVFSSGGQPRSKKAYGELARIGIRKIISFCPAPLRGKDPSELWSDRGEGFSFDRFPIPDRGVPKNFEIVVDFIKLVGNFLGKIYGHCREGNGRARLMRACWEVANGLSPDEAIQDALRAGVRFSWKLPKFVRNFFAAPVAISLPLNSNILIGTYLAISFSLNSLQQKFVRDFAEYWNQHHQPIDLSQTLAS